MAARNRDDIIRLNGIEAERKITLPMCKTHFAKQPMKVQKGMQQYIYDDAGSEYLDCCGNIAHVGHCHPRVAHMGKKQLEILCTAQGFVTDVQSSYTKKLLTTVPPGLFDTVLLVNSGSEAVDLALRLAQNYTKRKDIICNQPSVFGHSSTLASFNYRYIKHTDFKPYSWVHHIPICNSYRGAYADSPTPVEDALAHMKDLILELEKKKTPVAGYLLETINTSGGNLISPTEYLAAATKLVKDAGGLVIVDEVLAGLGRLGMHWWPFQHFNFKPDILVCGRSLGNGQPLSAVLTTQAIACSILEYANSYGGNPVSCAMGMAVLEVISDEGMLLSSTAVGNHLKSGLTSLIDKHHNLGDVRGIGLSLVLDIVEAQTSKKPSKDIAERLSYLLRDKYKILVPADGPDGNCLFINPPLCFSLDNSRKLVQSVDLALTDVENGVTETVKSLYELNEEFQIPGDIFDGFMKRRPSSCDDDSVACKWPG
ncbi:hypothetical protein EB796_018811 [Bugula neritina]|uniref:AGXT2 n=1 Tax=Bugula neritina TaxID=10212 RepID=A0A7J7JA17_BUGNE|nr:hypothetical protein EB796_018811 [Bugula neritina]